MHFNENSLKNIIQIQSKHRDPVWSVNSDEEKRQSQIRLKIYLDPTSITVYAQSSDPILFSKLLYKMGLYFLDINIYTHLFVNLTNIFTIVD